MKYYYKIYENSEWEIAGMIEAPAKITYKEIEEAFGKAREVINLWLDDEPVPADFDDCAYDKEFIVRQLELSFGDEVAWIDFEEEYFEF